MAYFLYNLTMNTHLFPHVASEFDLRGQVAKEFFANFHTIIENNRVDFVVSTDKQQLYKQDFLWAESKLGNTPIETMFAQLLLTIKLLVSSGEVFPPTFLGVFNRTTISFIEYHNILEIFNLNDFDWTERPSGVSHNTVNTVIPYLKDKITFSFDTEAKEIKEFITKNFVLGKTRTSKLQVNKNNFITVFNKWMKEVYPHIHITDKDTQEALKKAGIIPGDFFLADLISKDNKTIAEGLKIVLNQYSYELNVKVNLFSRIDVDYMYHESFWNKYQRPPKKEYSQYMLDRHDLLVPQDIRERKGAYFTPQIWVEKAHEYLTKTLGENWQDEYYIWDCCAGTCNLLTNLANPYRIWASTLDTPDVNIVHEAIKNKNKRMNLLESHVFQFDFLNDSFDKLPQSLRDVLDDEEKRKKLIILINPPYAEAGNAKQRTGTGENKAGTSNKNKMYETYKDVIGKASNELFALFFIRIKKEINGCLLAQFSKLKTVQAPNFENFRQVFNSKLESLFLMPANTFDNVSGKFPIGFFIWNTGKPYQREIIQADVFDSKGNFAGIKNVNPAEKKLIGHWLAKYKDNTNQSLGMLNSGRNDFQNQGLCYIKNDVSDRAHSLTLTLTLTNILYACVFFAVRHVFEATWLNDRDQFLYPTSNKSLTQTTDAPLFSEEKEVFLYEQDTDFQNDCLIFTLFHGQNAIKSSGNKNPWIPFTAAEVHAKDNFRSNFMSDYIKTRGPFTPAAQAVLDAGRELWTYYHDTIKNAPAGKTAYVDASLYEIREYFKERNEKGRLNTKSTDEHFNELDGNLRATLKALAVQIQPKVYEYGFLKD